MKLETGKNASLISFNGISPKIHPSAFLCEGVRIIGDVEIGEDSSIWYNCVVRGDVHYVKIGNRTNVQDLSMLHVTNDTFPLVIGNEVTIAHCVALHGATLHDNCMVGIGAKVLDGAVINSFSLVAAGSLVREGFTVPSGTMVAGVPAKVVRDLTDEEIKKFSSIAGYYVGYVNEYKKMLIL